LIADNSSSYICQLKNVFHAPINKKGVLSPSKGSIIALLNIEFKLLKFHYADSWSMSVLLTFAQYNYFFNVCILFQNYNKNINIPISLVVLYHWYPF